MSTERYKPNRLARFVKVLLLYCLDSTFTKEIRTQLADEFGVHPSGITHEHAYASAVVHWLKTHEPDIYRAIIIAATCYRSMQNGGKVTFEIVPNPPVSSQDPQ